MFLWLKTLYRKRAVTWPFIFYTIIWTLSTIYRKTTSLNIKDTGYRLLENLYVPVLFFLKNVLTFFLRLLFLILLF
ncbi:hypothetical protein DRJ73_12050 [Enterococcus faecalis]|nr:hypothetical protein DRJ73_12050 [Enterococcus faecalis]